MTEKGPHKNPVFRDAITGRTQTWKYGTDQLRAEVGRLRERVSDSQRSEVRLIEERNELRAEVERLRAKADKARAAVAEEIAQAILDRFDAIHHPSPTQAAELRAAADLARRIGKGAEDA